MPNLPCAFLDGYLGRWLSESERATFEVHLAGCAACREAVREAEQLESLLRRAAIECTEIPESLEGRIRQRIALAKRRRTKMRTAFAIAASLFLAGLISGWILLHRHEFRGSDKDSVVAHARSQTSGGPPPRRHALVIMAPASSYMPVTVRAESPDVTIVWLFSKEPQLQSPTRLVASKRENRSKS
jgi:anti-sigma factor RsiW